VRELHRCDLVWFGLPSHKEGRGTDALCADVRNPLNMAPNETPQYVLLVSRWLALYILPRPVLGLCIFMRLAKVPRPPYFAYFCVFASIGTLCFGRASANSPLSVVAGLSTFVWPIPLFINFFHLQRSWEHSFFHRGAKWASGLSACLLLLLWFWSALSS
jgi:hypothetical protein